MRNMRRHSEQFIERPANLLQEGIWPGTESNCRHEDFQSSALPTELPGRTEVCSSLDEWVVLAREPQSLSISNIRRQCAATPESGDGQSPMDRRVSEYANAFSFA